MMRALLPLALTIALLAGVAAAQVPFGGGDDSGNEPIDIKADNAIELHQDEKAYVARGNAQATRGDATVYGDVLVAYYRDTPSGGNQVYRLVAQGHVHIVGPNQEVFGGRAVYDMDQKVAVVTGDNLKLVTRNDVITARDSLEYYDTRQLAVARGDAVATRGDNRMRADVLLGQFTRDAAGQTVLQRVDGVGNVLVTTPRDVARSEKLVYTLSNDVAVLLGNVKITRGDNQINGDAAEFNMTTKVSRVISSGSRVSGLLLPGEKDGPGSKDGQGDNGAGRRTEEGAATPADAAGKPK